MPYVIGVKNGSVVKDKVGTINLNEEQTKYSEFTKEQHEELKSIYTELFESIYPKIGESCDKEEACG